MQRFLFVGLVALLAAFIPLVAQDLRSANETFAVQTWVSTPNMYAQTKDSYKYFTNIDGAELISKAVNINASSNLDSLPGMRLSIGIVKKLSASSAIIRYTLARFNGMQFAQKYSWLDTINTTASYFVPQNPISIGDLAVDSLWRIDYNPSYTFLKGDKAEVGFSHYRALTSTSYGRLQTTTLTHDQETTKKGITYATAFDSTIGSSEKIKILIVLEEDTSIGFLVDATAEFTVKFYEAPTDSTVFGDTLSIVNKKRTSLNTTSAVITKNYIHKVGGEGTFLISHGGGARRVGTSTGSGCWALDGTKKYYLLITSEGASNHINVLLSLHKTG